VQDLCSAGAERRHVRHDPSRRSRRGLPLSEWEILRPAGGIQKLTCELTTERNLMKIAAQDIENEVREDFEQEIQEEIQQEVDEILKSETEELYKEVLDEFEDQIDDRLKELTDKRSEELWEEVGPGIRERFEKKIHQAIADRLGR
jgi:hypothetical protein